MAATATRAAATLKIGNTQIRIADDFCRDKTEAEIRETLARIARAAQQHLSAVDHGRSCGYRATD